MNANSFPHCSHSSDHDLTDADYEAYFDLITANHESGIPRNELGPPTFKQYYGLTPKAAMQYLDDVAHPLEWFLREKALYDPAQLQSVKLSNLFQRAFVASANIQKSLERPRDPLGKQYGAILNKCHNCSDPESSSNPYEVPIVVDTGASISLSPFLEDFTTPLKKPDVDTLQSVNSPVKIDGVGTVEWEVRDQHGQVALFKTKAYYVPSADIRLFSPQSYFKENKRGYGWFDHKELIIRTVDDLCVSFPYNPGNLPMMLMNELFSNVAGVAGVTAPLAFNLRHTDVLSRSQGLLQDLNVNLTRPQKEVLLWHYRLAHAGLGWIQDLMYVQKGNHGEQSAPPLIPSKHSASKRCDMEGVKCPSCLLAKQHRRSPGSSTTKAKPSREMVQ